MKFFSNKFFLTSLVAGIGMTTFITAGQTFTPVYAASSVVTVGEPAMTSLDPTQWGGQILIDQGTILEGLYGYNQHNKLVPKIASGYKVTNGGKTWTFFLRHNARWSNGKPVTANDFYYAWMRMASPQDTTGALWASVMQYAVNGWQYHFGAAKANQVGLKVISPYELQINLYEPQNILGDLPLSGSMPLYAPDVNANPTNWYLPQYFVGDGPYVVSSFVPNGAISLTRNTNYVGASNEINYGNLQQINIIPSSSVPVEDFMGNKLDLAVISNPSDYGYIISHLALKNQIHVSPDYMVTYLEYDKSITSSPLDNELVRKAIAMAVERTPIVQSVLDFMGGADRVFGPKGWGPVKYETGIPQNIAKAKQLLAKAGYPNGKGIPTLTLYTQTQANNPTSVTEAEAIMQELSQNLGIKSQIDPLAQTQYQNVTWGGLNQGIKPGFVLATGVANWIEPSTLAMQADTVLSQAGGIGPVAYRKYLSNWYFPSYDPVSINKYGNPDNTSMGLKWSDWIPLQKAVQTDSAYLKTWMAKQPKWYQQLNAPSPGSSTADLWNGLVASWKQAKTSTDKHNAWVNAWKFIGNFSVGNGGTQIGLDGQVYVDQHEPAINYQYKLLSAKLNSSFNTTEQNHLAAQIVNLAISSGYSIPLNYSETFYLERTGVTGAQPNPFSWGNFYQLQYLSIN